MKDITFKQVLHYLRELEDENRREIIIRILYHATTRGSGIFCTFSLSENEKRVLNNLGLTYKFREDIQEWEINLIDDE